MSQIPLDEATGRRPLADLVGAGITVPLVQGGEARYVNLDYAASAPSLAQVVGTRHRGAPLVRKRPPRLGLPVPGQHGALRVGPGDRPAVRRRQGR